MVKTYRANWKLGTGGAEDNRLGEWSETQENQEAIEKQKCDRHQMQTKMDFAES